MRIWLSTAPLAFRLKGAGGGTVDNRNQQQGLHLRNPKTCPNKPGHLCHAGRISSAVPVGSHHRLTRQIIERIALITDD